MANIGRLARVSGIKARGHNLVTGPEGTVESETYTCAHCNCGHLIPRNAGEEIAGKMCMPCNQMICPSCVKRAVCEPTEKMIERLEAEARQRDQLMAACDAPWLR